MKNRSLLYRVSLVIAILAGISTIVGISINDMLKSNNKKHPDNLNEDYTPPSVTPEMAEHSLSSIEKNKTNRIIPLDELLIRDVDFIYSKDKDEIVAVFYNEKNEILVNILEPKTKKGFKTELFNVEQYNIVNISGYEYLLWFTMEGINPYTDQKMVIYAKDNFFYNTDMLQGINTKRMRFELFELVKNI